MKLRLGLLRGRAHPHGLSRIKPGGSVAGFGHAVTARTRRRQARG